MGALGFTLVKGKQTIDKDPDDILRYGVNLADEIAISGAAIASVEATDVGVTIVGDVLVIQDSYVIALVSGGDTAEGAENYIRFRVSFDNDERVDKTIYFAMVEE